MNFDIDAIEQSTRSTFDVVVGHQDIDGKPGDPVGFRVLGPGSDEYAAAERAIQIMNVKEAALRKTAVDLTTDDGAALVADGGAKRRQVMVDHCVIGWFGFMQGDQPAEFNKANLARILKARPLWCARLVGEIENEANFGAG
jgi:hypothetical protein